MVIDNLPDGWEWIKLQDFAPNPKNDVVDGPFGSNLKASEYVDSGVPIIRLQNIDRNQFLNKKIQFVTPEKAQELKRHSFQKGDIVITKLGDPLGKACVVPDDFEHGIIVADVVRARIDPNAINKKYLVYAINAQPVIEQLEPLIKGSTRPRVNLNHIRDLLIPTAPLPEQERIVAKIEELFTQLEAGTAALKRVRAGLKRYKASVLKAACEGTLLESGNSGDSAEKLLRGFGKFPLSGDDLPSLPDGWCWTQLGDLASHITSGSRGWAQYYSDDGAIFIRAQDINTDKLVLEEIAHVNPPRNSAEVARTRVFENDLLITITGANVTKTAKVNVSLDEAYMSQHVGLVRPITAELSDYLYYWIICPAYGRKELEKLAYGAGKPGLNLTNIRELKVPLPPLAEQRRIVAEVERRLSVAQEVESVVAASVARAGRLRQSVLKSAFEGRLG